MFKEGLLSLMTNIAYIRQSNLLEHFLETRLLFRSFYHELKYRPKLKALVLLFFYGDDVQPIYIACTAQVTMKIIHVDYTRWSTEDGVSSISIFSHETNFVKFRCVKNFISVTKPLLYMNLVTPLSCFYQKFISKFICQKAKDT